MTTDRIIINTAGRAETLSRKTLPLLESRGIDSSLIQLWVPNEESRDEYRRILDRPDLEIEIAPHDPTDKRLDVIGIEPVGLGRARNHVLRQYAPGSRLIFIDDDLTDIWRATSPTTRDPILDLPAFFDRAWLDLDATAATLWGIYPAPNPYFMKKRVRIGLTYICGGLYGILVTGRPHEYVTLDDKEDFERSIRHYLADGNVVRYEDVALGTQGYAGEGGLQLSRTPERVRLASEWLVHAYPGLCSLNLTKKSGWAEVRLRDTRTKH